ncbi:hypothetical protein WA026_003228 [Henosepilachna vigintioctopunctata]|uniref:DHHA2 domain-containing protein n=1 Tax=Henosepilachna vigintioctopunctata TaxID=420089 RepID=A0AAW1TLM1_9CUCU
MGELQNFLKECRLALNRWKTLQEIHIVIGNESCDLDSMVSSLAYGFLLFKTLNMEYSKDKAVFPVLNVPRSQFHLRLEHCYLLNKVGIKLETLIFRPELNFEEIIEHFSLSNKSIKTYLVDHHVTVDNEDILNETVCKIFDHRPVVENHCWTKENVQMRINHVGSCSTIIGDEIFTKGEDIWNKDLAYLIYSTIVLDTKGLKMQNKATALDVEVASKLEIKFNFCERNSLYGKLMNLHCEISHLSPYEMLIKDLKCTGAVAFPRICILARNFMSLHGGLDALYDLCLERKSIIAVIIGSDQNSHEKKDIGVLFKTNNVGYIQEFVQKFKQFGLQESPTQLSNFFIFNFKDKKMTRKEIVPIIMKVYTDCKHQMFTN